MLDNKKVIEISQMIQDTNNSILQNPPKEVTLINALKPFFPEAQYRALDETIDMLYKVHAMKRMVAQIAPQQPSSCPSCYMHSAPLEYGYSNDSSIHDDGIYDYDASCMRRQSPPHMIAMIMAMALMGRN